MQITIRCTCGKVLETYESINQIYDKQKDEMVVCIDRCKCPVDQAEGLRKAVSECNKTKI